MTLTTRLAALADREQRAAIHPGLSIATDSLILFIDNEADIYEAMYDNAKPDRLLIMQQVRRLLSVISQLPYMYNRWSKFMDFYQLQSGVGHLLLFHVNIERVADHILSHLEDR